MPHRLRLPRLARCGSDGAVTSLADDFADLHLEELHQRTYLVRSYRDGANRMRIRGAVQDIKPAGLYIEGDPDPLEIHHMVVDLVVEFPNLQIVDARVVMETHPHAECLRIEDHYRNLVGLSIGRGFTHKVRELFGGPRGCTHTTALLQAMAPVAVQSMWSLQAPTHRTAEPGGNGDGTAVAAPRRMTDEDRKAMFRYNVNSCHVWAEDGEMVAGVLAGGEVPAPTWAVERLVALGRDPATWREPAS